MLYTLLIIVASILFFSFATGYILMREAVKDKNLQKILVVCLLLTPPLTLWAFLRFLFVPPASVPFSEELGRIEDEIEVERARTFGGKMVHPSFSVRWKASYMYAFQKAASKIDPPLAVMLKTRHTQLPLNLRY